MNRYVAHVTIEADTPLKVGSNNSDFLQDSPVQRDWNGLPMIPGTSIAGVLRKAFDKDLAEEIFGQENGSKVIFSNALLLDEHKQVSEGLLMEKSPFLQLFDILPIREHTAITEKGVAKEHGKFDEEVVYKGAKFKFSIEMRDDGEEGSNEKKSFDDILNLLSSPSFRLGGGSTKGFGKFNIDEIKTQRFDASDYSGFSSSLNHTLSNPHEIKRHNSQTHTVYRLSIKPDDFFMFGSGFGDGEADMTPVYEKVVDYEKQGLSEEHVLIPASSIKGAISHRTTYHYNLQNKLFAGNDEAKETIKEIFGEAKNSKKKIEGSRGKVIFSDLFVSKKGTKVFDHVSIDRFTGGAIDGALFQEKTVADDSIYQIEILVEKNIDETYVKAFESALTDITTGMLALGGATTKGHGVFSGEWSKV